MADPTTTNIILATPPRGGDVGTWDVPLNGDMTIIDACFGAVTTVALSNVPVALTITQVQASLLRFTGTLAGNIAVTIPAIIKSWYVENLCTISGVLYVTLGNASGGQIVGLPPGEVVQVVSDGTNVKFVNLGRVGTYLDDCGATVPTWVTACTIPPYLNCDGSTYSSVTYPFLFAKLGTTTLPDKRGRQGIALNQGTGRVTTAGSGVDGDTRFAFGGSQNKTITTNELPASAPSFIGAPAVLQFTSPPLTSAGTQVTPAGSGGLLGILLSPSTINYTPAGTISNLGNGVALQIMNPTVVYGITMIRAA